MVADSPYLEDEALQDLTLSLLALDPRNRISAVDCLARSATRRSVHAGPKCRPKVLAPKCLRAQERLASEPCAALLQLCATAPVVCHCSSCAPLLQCLRAACRFQVSCSAWCSKTPLCFIFSGARCRHADSVCSEHVWHGAPGTWQVARASRGGPELFGQRQPGGSGPATGASG